MLADEPTGALDSATGREIMTLLDELNDRGMTVILVTHEHEVARYARRLLTFRDGHLIGDQAQDGMVEAGVMNTPELRSSPA